MIGFIPKAGKQYQQMAYCVALKLHLKETRIKSTTK